MKIVVDRDRCEANAICEGLVSAVFRIDDDGVLQVDQVALPAADLDLLRRAVRLCPRAALELHEE